MVSISYLGMSRERLLFMLVRWLTRWNYISRIHVDQIMRDRWLEREIGIGKKTETAITGTTRIETWERIKEGASTMIMIVIKAASITGNHVLEFIHFPNIKGLPHWFQDLWLIWYCGACLTPLALLNSWSAKCIEPYKWVKDISNAVCKCYMFLSRHRPYDRDRARRNSHRSRSPSRDGSRDQSRSHSRSRSHSERYATSSAVSDYLLWFSHLQIFFWILIWYFSTFILITVGFTLV